MIIVEPNQMSLQRYNFYCKIGAVAVLRSKTKKNDNI